MDLFWLSIKLGNTVGDGDDVKALLPSLFERLVMSDELDPGVVLNKLPHQNWQSWPAAEQSAVHGFLDQVWRAVLSEFPSRTGAFADPADFLRAVAAADLPLDRFLAIWDEQAGEAPDRHLAEFVNNTLPSCRVETVILVWVGRKAVRNRLFRAYEREHENPEWADIFARAYDLAATFGADLGSIST
ncbi:hypothetical protein [Nocardia aurantiaca]|uniref:Uncharacterized protein n=1 Tax=Nocardia aurantiaca TaxID=2675850 RepID=A0A6I3KZ57_9NOCA|nr:hypothetical protein [Nocardia aurantiaca]MTE13524.1 hypothetical protein [Nocardia aurantiaca]